MSVVGGALSCSSVAVDVNGWTCLETDTNDVFSVSTTLGSLTVTAKWDVALEVSVGGYLVDGPRFMRWAQGKYTMQWRLDTRLLKIKALSPRSFALSAEAGTVAETLVYVQRDDGFFDAMSFGQADYRAYDMFQLGRHFFLTYAPWTFGGLAVKCMHLCIHGGKSTSWSCRAKDNDDLLYGHHDIQMQPTGTDDVVATVTLDGETVHKLLLSADGVRSCEGSVQFEWKRHTRNAAWLPVAVISGPMRRTSCVAGKRKRESITNPVA